MGTTSYAIALGSNRRNRWGPPAAALRAATTEIGAERLSRIRSTPALGPAGRSFANAVAILRSELPPPALLARLKTVEAEFGRRPSRRWGPRVIDLDIILWSGGRWRDRSLEVPHPAFRERRFVLEPLAEMAPFWRDPVTGLTVCQLLGRQARRRPVDPCSPST
ncbi:MAG: 2-amino-4-hydroxy-6-hydroxymethyldihydropteridinepyrophosphokinase [uncultured Sphingomonadaceae bacterium]|uniref:2-amino-4-hydroxy-6-hydroxymethyldihydropteridine pyrophosphokinase n=1 Tax=uncultured Sphingomonadaceae bacterium TaxID=169976 RepID=A0A6J4TRH1_9SPHN|nr:MAG: 2-amino-4-hydroxy-6-hydroxymethyldihydropteridinepyrophosphokinase [uncultured Sphingomonadaceae bacterium]